MFYCPVVSVWSGAVDMLKFETQKCPEDETPMTAIDVTSEKGIMLGSFHVCVLFQCSKCYTCIVIRKTVEGKA